MSHALTPTNLPERFKGCSLHTASDGFMYSKCSSLGTIAAKHKLFVFAINYCLALACVGTTTDCVRRIKYISVNCSTNTTIFIRAPPIFWVPEGAWYTRDSYSPHLRLQTLHSKAAQQLPVPCGMDNSAQYGLPATCTLACHSFSVSDWTLHIPLASPPS